MSSVPNQLALVGHQPEPVVLPALQAQPHHVTLLHTDRTRSVADNAKGVLEGTGVLVTLEETLGYEFDQTMQKIKSLTSKGSWELNVTSGTKPMLIAALRVAEHLNLGFLYMESESGTQILHRYTWEGGSLSCKKTPLQVTITIEQFLACYGAKGLGTMECKNSFEAAVAALAPSIVDESWSNPMIGPNLEVDLILRCRNTIAFVECASGKNNPKGKLDQLVQASEKHRFGTFTKRILVTAHDLDPNNQELAKLAGIDVIHVEGYDSELTDPQKATIHEGIEMVLGKKHRDEVNAHDSKKER